jgi:choloylglycine hydrolase
MKNRYFFIWLVIFMMNCQLTQACTGIKLVAKDGALIHGRTLEFGIPLDLSLVAIPRGYSFVGQTTTGKGLAYQAKYATLGAMTFDDLSVLDGINEKGLAVGTFYFPGFAGYTELTAENQSKALSAADFPNWLITQFATIEEIKAAITQVVIVPTPLPSWQNSVPPFHYIVYDSSGKSLVIEPINGQLVLHDNPLGVLTNSPAFDWHMTNLRNYINLKAFNAAPLTINGLTFAPFGQGSGMHGLPGDFTPPSRFVRAAIYSYTAMQPANAQAAILQTFHILNQFDIPLGLVRNKQDNVVEADFTLFTVVRDPVAKKIYFKSYEDQSIYSVDLNHFDLNAKEIKKLKINKKQQYLDLSNEFN